MKSIKYFLIILLCLVSPSYAAFQNLDVGARPLGMAGAFTCVADDANSVVWNVAGLRQIEKAELTAMYSRFQPDLIDSLGLSFAALVYPLGKSAKLGVVGISYINLGSGLYNENVFSLSYSNRIPRLKKLLVGLNLKYLQKVYSYTPYMAFDQTFAKKLGADGIGIDFGLFYELTENLALSLTGKNVNEPNICLLKKDIVPSEYRLGAGYKINDFVVDIEGVVLNNANRDKRILLGSELWLLGDTIGLRSGIGFGTKEYKNLGLGASYRLNLGDFVFQIDYGFTYSFSSLVNNSTGNHYFSSSIKF